MKSLSSRFSDKKTEKQIEALLLGRNFADADRQISLLLATDADHTDAHYLRGVSQYLQGKLPPAITALKKCLELDPRHTDAAICLSVLYNDLGKYEEGKRVFELANHSVAHQRVGDDPSIDRKFCVKHLEIADLYFRYRRYDEAIEEYGKAILLDPTALDARIRRAKAYAKKGFLGRAMQELQSVKGDHPGFLPARIQLGLLHYSQGNILDAELEWQGVLSINSQNREAINYLEMLTGQAQGYQKSPYNFPQTLP